MYINSQRCIPVISSRLSYSNALKHSYQAVSLCSFFRRKKIFSSLTVKSSIKNDSSQEPSTTTSTGNVTLRASVASARAHFLANDAPRPKVSYRTNCHLGDIFFRQRRFWAWGDEWLNVGWFLLSTMWNAILIIFIENKLPILCQSSTFITVSAASSTETTVVAKSRESGKQESTTSKVTSTGYNDASTCCLACQEWCNIASIMWNDAMT